MRNSESPGGGKPGERGPAGAPVTILEFGDLECPYSAQVAPVIEELLRAYPDQVRFTFKNRPLSGHLRAPLAHEALMAAGAQGKFWEMYALLVSHRTQLAPDDLRSYARELSLDMARFDADLEQHRYRWAIADDQAEADSKGATGTPTFFINGKKMVGARPLEAFKAAVEAALHFETASEAAEISETSRLNAVATNGAPFRGPPQAAIELVEFSDLRCPFCQRAEPTLRNLLAAYPTQVKWVFKNFPLSFHEDSALAHQSSLAAGTQGQFWEMHDLIFAHSGKLRRTDVLGMARDLRLDMSRFEADLDSPAIKAAIQADADEGQRLGVSGTPTFFINGRSLEGAPPLAQFKQVIEDQLVKSPQVQGTKPSVIAAENLPADRSGGPEITITCFFDLESPLATQATMLIQETVKAYPGRIRVVVKSFAPEYHPRAGLLHEAVLAAGAQGKFWEMYNLILANPKNREVEDLLGYAKRLGIDREKFKSDLQSHAYASAVLDDQKQAKLWEVRGAPVFFVNARRIDGVQQFNVLRQAIEAELRRDNTYEADTNR